MVPAVTGRANAAICGRLRLATSRTSTPQNESGPVREGMAELLPHVYRFAIRLTGDAHRAEDLTQETLLRGWRKQHQLKDERALRVWLFRIAANLWKDEMRRAQSPIANAKSLTGTQGEHISSASGSPGTLMEHQDELAKALKLLDSLPTRQRAVLYLTAVEELTLGEVGEILQIEKNTAKVNLSLARKRMREEFSKST
jgi:RNA polymerase sigma-70 factor (ECF subfamily)